MLARQQLRRFTWLTLCVMLGLALAPTVSRALSVRGAAGLQHGHAVMAGAAGRHAECDEADAASLAASASASVNGSPAEEPSAAASSAEPAAHPAGHAHHNGGAAAEHDHFNHCPMCGVAATPCTVSPPAPNWVVAVPETARRSVPRGDAVLLQARAWSAHRPRGPPSAA